MIRAAIQRVLELFDYRILEAKVATGLREQNLARFGELVYDDIRNIMQEVASSDKRVTVEEKNRGYFVRFNGHILFRVAVNVFTERAEVVIDRRQVVQYLGLSDSSLDNYGPTHKVSAAIRKSVAASFSNTMHEHLQNELDKL